VKSEFKALLQEQWYVLNVQQTTTAQLDQLHQQDVQLPLLFHQQALLIQLHAQ
jgi:hypothetical protein